jgi:hypothetical protein
MVFEYCESERIIQAKTLVPMMSPKNGSPCNERTSTLREVMDEPHGYRVLDPFILRLHGHFELSGTLGRERRAQVFAGDPTDPHCPGAGDAWLMPRLWMLFDP